MLLSEKIELSEYTERLDELFRRIDAYGADGNFQQFDLQRFSAEDEGRTEDAGERRKREEREKGNIPKSQDMVSALVLIGTVVALFFMASLIYSRIKMLFIEFLGGKYQHLDFMEDDDIKYFVFNMFFEAGKISAPIFMVAIAMGIIANISQVGLLFTLKPLSFKPEKLIPDFKKVLPVRRTMYNLAKVMVQAVIIGIVAYISVVNDFLPMLKSGRMELTQAISLFAWVSFKMLLVCAIVLFLLSVPDFFYQKFEYDENLKITVSESKRERKDEEGDPLLRQRQRERGMELRQQRNMLKEVPRADVVITNPTHYAVALEYDIEKSQAPIVIAKGADHLAFLIRTIAKENNVMIQENPVLARVLYREVEIGQEIPRSLYQAVSLIFASLESFRKKKARTGV